MEINAFWLPVKDIASIQAFYAAMSQFGITNLFGRDSLLEIEPFCNAGGVYTQICNVYLRPVVESGGYAQTSLRDFAHV